MSSLQSFDYIIVGGGNAGLVVASRLSEDVEVTVCVLEAGQNLVETPEMSIPGLRSRNARMDDRIWRFNTVPQSGIKNRSIYHPRGKTLGGTSSINTLLLGRGHADDYNALERLGNKGWNWETMLKYFKKSESFTVTPEQARKFGVQPETKSDGANGPLQRTLPTWNNPTLDNMFFEAMKFMGVPYINNPFNGDNSGSYISTYAIHPTDAVRSSSVSAYYEPIKHRENLHVFTGAYVTQIMLESDGCDSVVAKGVKYREPDSGQLRVLSAKREVILSAGSFQTPQLLELSGIGDKQVLQAHRIETLVDLPGVGKNLQDHSRTHYIAEIPPYIETQDILLDLKKAQTELDQYHKHKSGMFATGIVSALAFLPLTKISEPDRIKQLIASVKPQDSDGHDTTWQIQKDLLIEARVPQLEVALIPAFLPTAGSNVTPEPEKRYISFLIGLQHTFSRGTVHISSSDPFTLPSVNPNTLKHNVDLELMVESIKFCRRLVQTPPYETFVVQEVIPGPQVQSNDEIREFVRDTLDTIFHPIGTASMLPRGDGGVVDETLKVYGTKNLRVIDASILPIHITGHPQATVYGIAERGADMIKVASNSKRSTKQKL